jgi:hypothetical protein
MLITHIDNRRTQVFSIRGAAGCSMLHSRVAIKESSQGKKISLLRITTVRLNIFNNNTTYCTY